MAGNERWQRAALVLALLLAVVAAAAAAAPTAEGCKACKDLVNGIQKGLDHTANSKGHGGGNTDWEERRLKAWSHSELRLVETLDFACGKKDNACLRLLEDAEDTIAAWFYSKERDATPLLAHLCIDQLRLCCPAGYSGRDCHLACPVDVNGAVCSGRGRCRGDGLRTGPATCACNATYAGDQCQECAPNYTQDDQGGCAACHSTCDGQCSAAGPQGCVSCRSGLFLDATTRTCEPCDAACSSCDAAGADHCIDCASGFERVTTADGHAECVNVDDCAEEPCHETERCVDLINGHRCVCDQGFVRNGDGDGCRPETWTEMVANAVRIDL